MTAAMTLISRQVEVDQICQEIDKGERCAIDLEFIPERTYALFFVLSK